jgi:chemotaxis response regulator CheB
MHMPVGYTEMYAKKLNESTNLTFREAKQGDLLEPGVALLAPAVGISPSIETTMGKSSLILTRDRLKRSIVRQLMCFSDLLPKHTERESLE